jgi:hypothetical protein
VAVAVGAMREVEVRGEGEAMAVGTRAAVRVGSMAEASAVLVAPVEERVAKVARLVRTGQSPVR